MGLMGGRGGVFSRDHPFKAVATMRAHLFFGIGGFLEECRRMFFITL